MLRTYAFQIRLAVGFIAIFIAASCDRAPLEVPAQVPAAALSGYASELADTEGRLLLRPLPREQLPAVRIDMPAAPRDFDADDAALINAVRQSEGLVFIGLKPPNAARTLETGIVPGMTRAEVVEGHRLIEAAGALIRMSYVSIPAVLAQLEAEATPDLRKLPFVNYVEPAFAGRIEGGAEWTQQDTSWGARKVRAPQAWNANRGHGASITILDTGVDYQHLVAGDGPVRLSDCLLIDPYFTSCFDDHGHGSHVAGIAAARDDVQGYIGIVNYEGVFGQALASVKVCSATGYCPPGAVEKGIDWTTENGRARQIVNMSLRQEPSISLANAIAASYLAGNLLVAAAGNNHDYANVSYPARYSQVIAVAGTLPDDAAAGWITCPNEVSPYPARSNYGGEVELSAPFWARSMWLNDTYQTHCGTSMAVPVVAGTAALLWTKNPTWTNSQVRQHLQVSVKDLGVSGRDPYFGFGRIDTGLAVGMLPPTVSVSGPTAILSAGSYSWTASPAGGHGGYEYKWYRQTDYWWPRGAPTCHYQTEWELVSTSQSYSASISLGDYDFRLAVYVTSAGETGSNGVLVAVGDGSSQCPF